MTPRPRTTHAPAGSALIGALIIVVVVTGLTAAYLLITTRESRETFAAGQNQQAFFAAESGINAAVDDINSGADADKDGKSDADGHTLGTVTGTLVQTKDASGATTVTYYANKTQSTLAANSGAILGSYSVVSTYVPPVDADGDGVADLGSDLYNLTSAADNGTTATRAAVRTQAVKATTNQFARAMFGDVKVTLSGTVFADSYDSALGTYAAQAVNVDAVSGKTYARTNGDVGSNHDISISGSVTVMGDVQPGPTGSLSISGGGVRIAGSTTNLAEEVPLSAVNYGTSVASSGELKQTKDITDLSTGTYHYSDINLSGTAMIRVKAGQTVTVFSDGGLKMGAQNAIVVEPGGKLTFNSNGDVQIAGQGMTQGTIVLDKKGDPSGVATGANPYAGDVRINVTKGHSVDMSGTSDFFGVVYAPDTTVKFSGTSKFFGAVIGDSVADSGTQDFHYDERLGRDFLTPSTYYRIKGWTKIDDTTSIQGQFPTH